MLRPIRYLPIFLLAVALLAIGPPRALCANPPNKDQLLTSLSEARIKFKKNLPPARGQALVTVNNPRDNYSATAEFISSGSTSLVRFSRTDANGASRLYEVVLYENDRQTRYACPGWGHPSSINVSPRPNPLLPIPSLLPPGWSALDFSVIPVDAPAEADLFAAARRVDLVKVELLNDNLLRWTITAPKPPPPVPANLRQIELLDFNLPLGGILTRYRRESSTAAGQDLYVAQVECTWLKVGQQVHPQSRKFVAEATQGGKLIERNLCTTEIKEWLFKDVADNELTAQALAAPFGTPVVDEVLRVQYRYDGQSLTPPANATKLPPPPPPL